MKKSTTMKKEKAKKKCFGTSSINLSKKIALLSVFCLSLSSYGQSDNLIINGDAENGVTGWTDETPTLTWNVDDKTSRLLAPQAGGFFFNPGATDSAQLSQIVDLSAYATQIDNNKADFSFVGYVANHEGLDTSQITLEYLDATNTQVGEFKTDALNSNANWLKVTNTTRAPFGTRSVKVILNSEKDLSTGVNNDGNFDSLSLIFVETDNLIVNGSAENGITGWTDPATESTWTIDDATSRLLAPQEGTYFFDPGTKESAESELSQIVDLSNYAKQIDSNTADFSFIGYIASHEGADTSQITLEYLDTANTQVGLFTTVPEASPENTWTKLTNTTRAPFGTRSVKITLNSVRTLGNSNNAYYDALSLKFVETNNLIINGSAENGITGWADPETDSSWTIDNATSRLLSTQEGTYFFDPGTKESAESELSQTIDLSNYTAQIDNNTALFSFKGYIASHEGEDTSQITLEYFDATNTQIGLFTTVPEAVDASWKLIQDITRAPSGTRSVKITLNSVRNKGNANNGYYDDLSLIFVESDNLIINGSAESGITGWTDETANSTWAIRNTESLAPQEGTYYFFPGRTDSAVLTQTIDLSPYTTQIDNNKAEFSFEGYVADFEGLDSSEIKIQYFNATGTQLGLFESGKIKSALSWSKVINTTIAPFGTRSVKISLISEKDLSVGNNNDGYHDNLSLTYTELITLSTTDVQSYNSSLNIYPNPASNVINIIKDENTIVNKVCIYNLLGKKVYSNTYTETINISNLNSGLYIVELHTNNSIEKLKIIKK